MDMINEIFGNLLDSAGSDGLGGAQSLRFTSEEDLVDYRAAAYDHPSSTNILEPNGIFTRSNF
jgi:hypothetical protein